MREIKFRAWNGHNMEQPVYEVALQYNGNYRLMQYTGLKDKNGVEIYEGDIVRGKEYYQYNVVKTEVAAVTYEPPSFRIGLINMTMNTGKTDPDLEVIGNIYENSELLK